MRDPFPTDQQSRCPYLTTPLSHRQPLCRQCDHMSQGLAHHRRRDALAGVPSIAGVLLFALPCSDSVPGSKFVKVVRPSIHHGPALLQELCAVVGRTKWPGLSMG